MTPILFFSLVLSSSSRNPRPFPPHWLGDWRETRSRFVFFDSDRIDGLHRFSFFEHNLYRVPLSQSALNSQPTSLYSRSLQLVFFMWVIFSSSRFFSPESFPPGYSIPMRLFLWSEYTCDSHISPFAGLSQKWIISVDTLVFYRFCLTP